MPCIEAILVCFLLSAQEFEVVSVRPNNSASTSSGTHSDQGRFRAENSSLRNLIVMAYGIKDYQLEGPDWLRTTRFDISAKFPEALPKEREKYDGALRDALLKMLAERFKLAAHCDHKNFSVLNLVVGKRGVKLTEVTGDGSHSQNSNSSNGSIHYEGTSVAMSAFAEFLSRRLNVPVLDDTGLEGFYNLKLEWSLEAPPSGDGKADGPVIADTAAGNLADAIQSQLGLRLEARKSLLEIVVVDHAERVPTEN